MSDKFIHPISRYFVYSAALQFSLTSAILVATYAYALKDDEVNRVNNEPSVECSCSKSKFQTIPKP